MLERILWALVGVWFLLYAVLAVTNLSVLWAHALMGFVALVIGVLALIHSDQ